MAEPTLEELEALATGLFTADSSKIKNPKKKAPPLRPPSTPE